MGRKKKQEAKNAPKFAQAKEDRMGEKTPTCPVSLDGMGKKKKENENKNGQTTRRVFFENIKDG